MSGKSNRMLYDKCATNLQVKESTQPGCYKLYAGAYENECEPNQNTVISNKHNSVGVRVDIESDLKNQISKASRCVKDKHAPCAVNDTSKRCNPGIHTNPYLCERLIVPTNLKMPKNNGIDC